MHFGSALNPVGNCLKINMTKDAASTLTGALVVAGGVGIAKNLYVGGTIYGNITIPSQTSSIEFPWVGNVYWDGHENFGLYKIGNQCTIYTTSDDMTRQFFNSEKTEVHSNGSVLPVGFRPVYPFETLINVHCASGTEKGRFSITTDGAIHLYLMDYTLPMGGVIWIYPVSLTYVTP